MEVLGFTDASSVWSDSPIQVDPAGFQPVPSAPQGRHVAKHPEPDPFDSWEPTEIGRSLTGGNIRWKLIAMLLFVVAGAAAAGYWVYQQPDLEAEANATAVTAEAQGLAAALPTLEAFNEALTGTEAAAGSLATVEASARALFEVSGELPSDSSASRTAAATASSAALDGVRLAREADSYKLAVLPLLTAPELQTDPELIELDEAARAFGEWQIGFDEVRTALPDGVMSAVTEQLDILSADLTGILETYVDALREDDGPAARDALAQLQERLDAIADHLQSTLSEIQQRIDARIDEANEALGALAG